MLLSAAVGALAATHWQWDMWTPWLINIPPFVTDVPRFHAGQVTADADSAEDVADDPDAAVEEEDDEEEVLVEEDQMRSTVCVVIYGRLLFQIPTIQQGRYVFLRKEMTRIWTRRVKKRCLHTLMLTQPSSSSQAKVALAPFLNGFF